ncbi:hypothetical protein E5082_27540 [Streptomyces griseoluteus]|uniref:Uncharacterized protein n=1 Tax=Streptomyces griseoluteus TaxID=29306 RepID=A0A4Z1D5M1_STRGP|nr:hypothetical protein E5082_27540 [Streptomyces griseoluteus]
MAESKSDQAAAPGRGHRRRARKPVDRLGVGPVGGIGVLVGTGAGGGGGGNRTRCRPVSVRRRARCTAPRRR